MIRRFFNKYLVGLLSSTILGCTNGESGASVRDFDMDLKPVYSDVSGGYTFQGMEEDGLHPIWFVSSSGDEALIDTYNALGPIFPRKSDKKTIEDFVNSNAMGNHLERLNHSRLNVPQITSRINPPRFISSSGDTLSMYVDENGNPYSEPSLIGRPDPRNVALSQIGPLEYDFEFSGDNLDNDKIQRIASEKAFIGLYKKAFDLVAERNVDIYREVGDVATSKFDNNKKNIIYSRNNLSDSDFETFYCENMSMQYLGENKYKAVCDVVGVNFDKPYGGEKDY